MSQVDLAKLMKRVSEKWTIAAVMMIAGGLLGLLVSYAKSPVFESSAVFSVVIDYTQTGALTDVQEDQLMRGVGSVILSDRVIDKTLAQINDESEKALSRIDFLENSFLDREDFRWTLRYRDPDPKNAEMAVSVWAKNANAVIQEGLTHSLTSTELLDELEKIKICLFELTNGNKQSDCVNNDFDSVVNSINELSTRIQEEKSKSQGLFHAILVSPVNEGISSGKAIIGQRGILVLCGAIIGFILSISVIIFKELKRSRSI